MSVLISEDKKELVVICNCGCMNSYHIVIDNEDEEYGILSFMKSSSRIEGGLWDALKRKLQKIWCVIRNKDYCYADTIMTKKDFEEFKRYINKF